MTIKLIKNYDDDYQNFISTDKKWLIDFRKSGVKNFVDQDIPNTKIEDWKYTKVNSLKSDNFSYSNIKADLGSRKIDLPHIDAYNIYIINGIPNLSVSDIEILPDFLNVLTIKEALNYREEEYKSLLGSLTDNSKYPFIALNDAYLNNGLFIKACANNRLNKPIHIIYVNNGENEIFSNIRNIVKIEHNTEISIIESYVSIDNKAKYFNNIVSEVVLDNDSKLNYYKLQNESENACHISYMQTDLDKSSKLNNFTLQKGSALSRVENKIKLNESEAEANFSTAYFADKKQLLDTTCLIEHNAAHTNSNQFVKGVIDDEARGVFQGKVYVAKDSQKIEGNQLHKALLLSSKAEVDCKPELEIYADDVICSHGATAGELDEEQLFYLQSRGVDKEQAIKILVGAFLDDVIEKIEDDNLIDFFKTLVQR